MQIVKQVLHYSQKKFIVNAIPIVDVEMRLARGRMNEYGRTLVRFPEGGNCYVQQNVSECNHADEGCQQSADRCD